MQIKENLYIQIRSNFPILIKLYIPILVILFGTWLLSFILGTEIGNLTRDPVQIMQEQPYIGMLSNVGILFWCSSAAICFFSSTILRKNRKTRHVASFLFFSAVITSIILIDDLFLFHEMIFPNYLHINEKSVYSAYALIILIFLNTFQETILGTNYIILLFALGFLGLSIFFDCIPARFILGYYLFEDGFKFIGLTSWSFYFIRICIQHLNSNP